MIKQKKLFLLVSLLLIMSLVTACGGETPTSDTSEKATEAPATAAAEPTNTPVEAQQVENYECDDPLGCVEVVEGDPIVIASAFVVSGPNASLGLDTQYGVEIALKDRSEVLGHSLELQAEDGGCSAEGGQTAATKIASNKDVVAVVGHNCSSSCTPAAPIYDDAGLSMISPSCTAPSLTGADIHVPSFLRTAHNDSIQGKVAAEYAYNELGMRSAATIHDGSPYAEQLQAVFANTFKEMGGTITSQEAVNVGDTDMRPLLTSIAVDKPDLLFYPIFIAEGGFITAQSAEVTGLENTTLMGADGMQSPEFIEAAGEAGEGMYFTGPNLSFESDTYVHFLDIYTTDYGTEPIASFHAHAYDATNMILNALEKVAVESDDTLFIPRQALRDALYTTKDLAGITGNITCNEMGDCADPKIGVSQIQNGAFISVWPEQKVTTEDGDSTALRAADCEYGGKIKEIAAVDPLTVRFSMCKPDPAFPAKAAFSVFGIQPSEWIAETGGGGELLEHPIGTGPYMLEEWSRGDSIIYKRFDDYWGEPAFAETLVYRWSTEGAARLSELQAGTVHMITNVSPDDFDIVRDDASLELLPVASPNILYLAMTNTFEPFNNLKVRQAIAMGVDRQRIVNNFYPEGSEVASHFTPCSIPNGCAGDAWYDFDPEAAKALLAEAGYPDGFETTIFYRDVFRGYLPEPNLIAVEFQAQLEQNLGIQAKIEVMESGQFIDNAQDGRLDGLFLLGWSADYPHVTNFLDFHFAGNNVQFGDAHPEIYEVLEQASQIGDPAEAEALYVQANNAIRELVPVVPIVHGISAFAARSDVENAHARPFGSIIAALMDPGSDTFVFMQNAEPISLYCADESDGESLSACEQVVEALLAYKIDSGDIVPALATSCEANEDSTIWTCYLRDGVKFHDGSDFDATDVVASWSAGLDASSPYHVGNTGAWVYYDYLWDGLINAEDGE